MFEIFPTALRETVKIHGMTPVKIVLSTLIIGCCFGIVHELITVQLGVEDDTIGLPKTIESQSSILLALTRGFITSWWVALPIGALIAGFNYFGEKPSLEYRDIMLLVLKLAVIMFGIALFVGISAYLLADFSITHSVPRLPEHTDSEEDIKFSAKAWALTSYYLSGTIGSLIVCNILSMRRYEK